MNLDKGRPIWKALVEWNGKAKQIRIRSECHFLPLKPQNHLGRMYGMVALHREERPKHYS